MTEEKPYHNTQVERMFARSCEYFLEEMRRRVRHIKKELLKEKGATLILGAGVSQSAGLPSWNALLARATFLLTNIQGSAKIYNKIYGVSCAKDITRPDCNKVLNVFEGTDVLEIAAYLDIVAPEQLQMEGKATFSVLRTANYLNERYKGLVRYCLFPEGNFSIDKWYGEQKVVPSNTLIETAKLAAWHFSSCGKDMPEFRNNRSVITYNFDNLLEALLENSSFNSKHLKLVKGLKIVPLYDQEAPDLVPSDGKHLHIYHPHGYLDLCDPNGKESNSIVLSEESFYELERRNYNWSNFLLARALQDDLCLFIGFSGNDYNFRRILKNIDDFANANSEKIEDFQRFLIVTIDELVFRVLKMYSLEKSDRFSGEEDIVTVCDNDHIKRRILNYLKLKEFYWRKKGFLPIWATIEDVPHIINSLLE